MPSFKSVIQVYLKGSPYTVVKGDTMSGLAERWGMTLQGFADFEGSAGAPNRDQCVDGDLNRLPQGAVLQVPKLPADPSEAPASISLPGEIADTMQQLWEDSIAIKSKTVLLGTNDGDYNTVKLDRESLEHGGTYLWILADKEPVIDRTGAGNAGAFSPDISRAADHYVIGDFHTHPYTRYTDGIEDVPNVSWSGGDLFFSVAWGTFFDMMQSYKTIFGVIRTAATPRDANNNAEDVFDNEFQKHSTDSKGETFREAVRKAAIHTCNHFHLAYYEAVDTKSLSKVS